MKRLLCHTFLLMLALAAVVSADVKLPAVIGEGMVLQQGIAVPLWGLADEGENVIVEMQNQKVTATAKDGKWMVKLAALKAGGPFTLTITGKNKLEFKNVLVGEVWVCGGQSNMQWAVKQTNEPDKTIAEAKHPQIRLFTVPRLEADKPTTEIKSAWFECSPETVPDFSAVGYYFGRDLHAARKVPIGLIDNAVGGSPAESWMSAEAMQADEEYKAFLAAYPKRMEQWQINMEKYKADVEKAKAEGAKPPTLPGRPWMPAGLYNGMLVPIAPYAIKGAIWYQGESNATRAYQYRRLFPDMIRNWRATWGQGDFPFLFVQLAAFGPNTKTLGESDWAELREAQTMTLKASPHTGQALAIDYGTYDDIHPKNKLPVGQRLALAARAVAYGEKLTYAGPTYQAVKFKGNQAELSFTSIGKGLEARPNGSNAALKGFLIAGADKVFHEATAEIKGKRVVVSSPSVTNPVAVRYAWAKYPEVNFYNLEGLPAVPFRTDDWPGVTMGKK
ncbi:MAG: sialate O-acetylesterase [Acidobacteria bacterium]|nr:sialate O-acetylesterase [Acidobacteriota bacterium]